jgi:hypothetical protein
LINSELDKLNVSDRQIYAAALLTCLSRQANLEKQLKELNLRIIDLETKSYSRNPQSSLAATIRRWNLG